VPYINPLTYLLTCLSPSVFVIADLRVCSDTRAAQTACVRQTFVMSTNRRPVNNGQCATSSLCVRRLQRNNTMIYHYLLRQRQHSHIKHIGKHDRTSADTHRDNAD